MENTEFIAYIILLIPGYFIVTFFYPAFFIYSRKDIDEKEKDELTNNFIQFMRIAFVVILIIFIVNLFGL